MEKHAYIAYFADRSGKVIIAESVVKAGFYLSDDDVKNVVKIELIPFEVL